MAYRPYAYTTTVAAVRAVTYDAKRTNLVIVNLSGETCYWGVDSTLTTANGAPILNNGIYEAAFAYGLDPRIEIWLIGTAGGDVRIIESRSDMTEEPDPILYELQGIRNILLGVSR